MKLKINFSKDLKTGKTIDLKQLRIEFSMPSRMYERGEVANQYHIKTYGQNIPQILQENGRKLPVCPITGEMPNFYFKTKLVFGKYSPSCSRTEVANYIVLNNKSYIASRKRVSKARKGIKFSEETLGRMSESAKKREVHGHTGHKHSEETKQVLRELTIDMHKSGRYPKTKTAPHNKVKLWLDELFPTKYAEEFPLSGFSFDFKVGNTLIEVQGDFFHCNPDTRHAVAKSEMQKKNVARDVRKRNLIEKSSFVLLELWENDVLKNEEIIKAQLRCLKP